MYKFKFFVVKGLEIYDDEYCVKKEAQEREKKLQMVSSWPFLGHFSLFPLKFLVVTYHIDVKC